MAGAAFLAYLSVILRGTFIWDDDVQLLNNPHLRSWGGLLRTWTQVGPARGGTAQYYPLTFSVLWLEHALWGLNPLGYHLVNVALHAANAFLLMLVLETLAVPGALLAGLIFAVHPVHVESVAWIIELKNTLSGFFALWSLLLLLRPESRAGLALALFAAALASKTSVVVMPVVYLILEWRREGRLSPEALRRAAPFLALAFAAGLVTTWVETRQVGAEGGEWGLTAFQRVLVAGRAIWFYLGKLAWPSNLSLVYPRWTPDVVHLIFSAAAVGALFALKRLGRWPFAVALIYLACIGPTLGFINVYFHRYSFVADHFAYLASMAPIAAAAALLASFPAPLAGIVVVALGAASFKRGAVYESLERVWLDVIAKNPKGWLARNNYGVLLAGQGRLEEAVGQYELALRAPQPADHAETFNNLGLVMAAAGKHVEAVELYRRALLLKPALNDARHNLGVSLAALGRRAEAAAEFVEALRADPRLAQAHSNLGALLAMDGKPEEAADAYRRALALDPNLADAHCNLGLVLAKRGDLTEAIDHFEQALRLRPDHAAARRALDIALRQKNGVR